MPGATYDYLKKALKGDSDGIMAVFHAIGGHKVAVSVAEQLIAKDLEKASEQRETIQNANRAAK